MARNFEVIYTADDFIPPSSNHADQGVIQNRRYMAFDADTAESMYSKVIQMPFSYSGSGTLKADIFYAMASATSGTVNLEVYVEAITEADAIDTDSTDSFDTVNDNQETVPGTAGYISKLTITLTAKDSVAAGDYVRLLLKRDATDGTNDTATGDCRVYSITLYEET